MTVGAGENVDSPVFSPDYRYPIPAELESSLVEELIHSNPELAASQAKYVLATVEGNSKFSNLGRALECKLFHDRFNNDPEDMHKEYGAYEDASTFFLMLDKEGKKVAGVMRLIENGPEGLKSVNDLPTNKTDHVTTLSVPQIFKTIGIEAEGTLDVATIGAAPEYSAKALRGDDIVLASLMRAVYKYGLDTSRNDLVAIIAAEEPKDASSERDKSPYAKLKAVGLPIYTYVPRFAYLGAGENEFIHIPLPEVQGSVSVLSEDLYEYLFGDSDAALGGQCQLSFLMQ